MGGACRGSNTGSGDLNLASAHAHADSRVAEGGREGSQRRMRDAEGSGEWRPEVEEDACPCLAARLSSPHDDRVE